VDSTQRLLVTLAVFVVLIVVVSLMLVEVLVELVELLNIERPAELAVLDPVCSRFKTGDSSCHRLSTSRRSSSVDARASSNPCTKCAARMKLSVSEPMCFLIAL